MILRINRRRAFAVLRLVILLCSAAWVASGCSDKISSLGLQYYKDTIANQTSIRTDTGFIHFADTVRPFVTANGIDYCLTDSTVLMLIGQVNQGTENISSWGVLQFLPMSQDTVNTLIKGARLVLTTPQVFSYGDTANHEVNLVVYPTFGQIFDSTYMQPTITSTSVGTVDTLLPDSLNAMLSIRLDPSVIPNLSASSLAFVIEPGSKMDNVRGFGTIHNSNTTAVPRIVYYLNNGDSVVRYPTLDFHLVKDQSTIPTGEFSVRGSAGRREKVILDLTRPADTAQLTAFTTINDAALVLHVDRSSTRVSDVTNLAIGPYVVSLGTVDSACHQDGSGIYDTVNGICRFQVRSLVEQWLRNPSQNLGFVLQQGFAQHPFGGIETIGVEDYDVDRWTFYGPSCADTSKRPYFVLSYSRLK